MISAGQSCHVRQRTLESLARRLRACTQYNRISAGAKHILVIHLGSQLDLNLGLFELVPVPVKKLVDLAAFGLAGGKPELPAKLVAALDERYPVAALGGNARGFQTRWATAHDQNFARRFDRGQAVPVPLELASNRRIDQARYPIIAHSPSDAELVAVDAGADVIGAPVARLVGKMGIGDLAAHPDAAVQREGVLGLVSLRRSLFPDAPGYGRIAA